MGDQFDFWLRQSSDKPLFPALQWSRPENRQLAGKLLVVGGNAHGFVAPATAFSQAEKAGAGVVRMLLPDSMRRYVRPVFEAGDFAPSTPSGSFGQQALAPLLDAADWADAVLLAGDFGRNSETAILLESFASKYRGNLAVAQDAIDYFIAAPGPILNRPSSLLVTDFSQLQKLAIGSRVTQPFTSQLDLLHFAQALCAFSKDQAAHLVIQHLEHVFVAAKGQVSSTPLGAGSLSTAVRADSVIIAAHAAVWWLQNPDKPFEALTTAQVV